MVAVGLQLLLELWSVVRCERKRWRWGWELGVKEEERRREAVGLKMTGNYTIMKSIQIIISKCYL